LLSNGEIAAGCNFEYGGGFGTADARAVHAEQSAISSALLKGGPKFKIQIVAVVAESARPFCCGNCLDAVMTYADRNLIIAACGMDGSVTVRSIEDVFPQGFSRIPLRNLPQNYSNLLERAMQSRFASLQLFRASGAGLTGAALLSSTDRIYSGVREDTASFHPISAIESALTNSRIHEDPKMKAIAFVSENGFICGRDRQKIFERADACEMTSETDVISYAIDNSHVEVCKAGELLPFGFSIRSITGQRASGK
jgi:cytidine deaminase